MASPVAEGSGVRTLLLRLAVDGLPNSIDETTRPNSSHTLIRRLPAIKARQATGSPPIRQLLLLAPIRIFSALRAHPQQWHRFRNQVGIITDMKNVLASSIVTCGFIASLIFVVFLVSSTGQNQIVFGKDVVLVPSVLWLWVIPPFLWLYWSIKRYRRLRTALTDELPQD